MRCARPRLLGGDPDGGWREIERALALTSGRFLLHQVLLARVYAVSTGNRELYERLLREVVATPAGALPEQRLANEVARRRARRYLSLTEQLF
jgi:hypothetical protein